MLVKTQDLKPCQMIDLEPYWVQGEAKPDLVLFAQSEYALVESVEPMRNGVQSIIYLIDAPSNVIVDNNYEWEVVS